MSSASSSPLAPSPKLVFCKVSPSILLLYKLFLDVCTDAQSTQGHILTIPKPVALAPVTLMSPGGTPTHDKSNGLLREIMQKHPQNVLV